MITPKSPYKDSWLKIEWAKQHIINFQELINTFIGGNNHRFMFDFNLQELKVTVNALPDDAGLLIGDALHNLRSAIDCAYYATALRAGCEVTDKTQLKVFPTREKLVSSIENGSIKRSILMQKFVVNDVRPYRTGDKIGEQGNEVLIALHDLNIIDKHIVMLPFVDVTQVNGVKMQIGGLIFDSANVKVEMGTVTDMAKVSPPLSPKSVNFTDHGKLSGDVLFDKELPFEGKPIIPVLHQLLEVSAGLVKAFETLRVED